VCQVFHPRGLGLDFQGVQDTVAALHHVWMNWRGLRSLVRENSPLI
jgi:hypothetical protein